MVGVENTYRDSYRRRVCAETNASQFGGRRIFEWHADGTLWVYPENNGSLVSMQPVMAMATPVVMPQMIGAGGVMMIPQQQMMAGPNQQVYVISSNAGVPPGYAAAPPGYGGAPVYYASSAPTVADQQYYMSAPQQGQAYIPQTA